MYSTFVMHNWNWIMATFGRSHLSSQCTKWPLASMDGIKSYQTAVRLPQPSSLILARLEENMKCVILFIRFTQELMDIVTD